MQLDTWFPLAVATCDLTPPEAITAGMLAALEPWIDAAAAQRRLAFAWTGDVNGCNDIHNQSAFAWLRAEVEREARAYVAALGGDVSRLGFYFQGSWPVLSRGHEAVSSHTHMTASVSAVYYLSVPAGSGGPLVFENVTQPNSLGDAFGEPGTAFTVESSSLNLREACYVPRPGWLVLFPARQPHAVRPHGADVLRIAITFDIALLDRADPRRPGEAWDAFAE